MRKIYLATSWRNQAYPQVLKALREGGHEVYDFRAGGFQWNELEEGFATSSNDVWPQVISSHPRALGHFAKDKAALDWCDTLVLLLPCGRSAHTEAGYAAGQGKEVIVVIPEERVEPELMYLLFDRAVFHQAELIQALSSPVRVMKVASEGGQSSEPTAPSPPERPLSHTEIGLMVGLLRRG